MADVVRLVDGETRVEVHGPEGDGTVQIQLGPAPYGVTFVGDLADLHRVFVEIDTLLSRLVTAQVPARQAP